MGQYFLIDESDDYKNTSQFSNLRVLFRTLAREMDGINQSLRRRTFEQKRLFDLYDCLLSPIAYLSYTNDERSFIEETYQYLFVWELKIKLVQIIIMRISKVPLVEYKVEEIKAFLDATSSVYEGLKNLLGNYQLEQNLRRIDFSKESLYDYQSFLRYLGDFLGMAHQALFGTKFEN